MSALELGDRLLCSRARVNSHRLRNGQLGAEEPLQLALVMLARAQASLGEREAAESTLLRVDAGGSARLRAEAAKVQALLGRDAAAPAPEPARPMAAHPDDHDNVSGRDGVSREGGWGGLLALYSEAAESS